MEKDMTTEDEKSIPEYIQETKSTEYQIEYRKILYRLFNSRSIPDDQLIHSFGLFLRSSALAKILFINEIYELILNKPGVIMEFGTWWGQNLALFENLRAIYEPFNQSRRVFGFDTFEGYPPISSKDVGSETIKNGGYGVTKDYQSYLEALIDYHEKNNVLGNIKKHQIIKGDVVETVPRFFKSNPEVIVALGYFDLALYEPTKICLREVLQHIVPGSVIMMDELNSRDYPGETIAFKEEFKNNNISYSIQTSRYMKDRTIIRVK